MPTTVCLKSTSETTRHHFDDTIDLDTKAREVPMFDT